MELDRQGRLVTLVPHRTLEVGDRLAVLARYSTGWALLTPSDYRTLEARFGRHAIEYDCLWPSEKSVVQNLWDCGLVAIDGQVMAGSPSQKTTSGVNYPSSLLLKLTGACNFSCTYCYDFDRTRMRANLSMDRAKEVTEYLLDKGPHLAITFHGGEPLLRFTAIRELVCYARSVAGDSKRLSFSIQTNASYMTDEVIEFLECNDFSVGISIDGHVEIANRLRSVRSGPSALAHVKRLLHSHSDFIRKHCGFLMVVSRTSAPHLLEFAAWLQDNNVKSLGFSFLDNEGAAKDLQHERLEPHEVISFWESVLAAVRAGDIKELALTELLSRIQNMYTLTPRNLCHRGPCGAANEFLVLDATGRFRTCDCVYHPYFEVGDSTTSVGQLPEVLAMAQRRVADRYQYLAVEGPICSECALFGLCGGTCPAKAISSAGSPSTVEPGECAVSRYLYPLLLEEFTLTEQPILSYFAYHQRSLETPADAE